MLMMLGLVHYAQEKSALGMKVLFSIIMVLCRPPEFLSQLHRAHHAYMVMRFGELVLMVGIMLHLNQDAEPWVALYESAPLILALCVGSGIAIIMVFIAVFLYRALGTYVSACCDKCISRCKCWHAYESVPGSREFSLGESPTEAADTYLPLKTDPLLGSEQAESEVSHSVKETKLPLARQNFLSDADARLELALKEGNPILVGLIIGDGANPNTVLESGMSMLHFAAIMSQASVAAKLCSVLLDYSAYVEGSVAFKGCTVLHIAAERERHDVALVLLEAKADVNARDSTGATPLARVRQKRNTPAGAAGEIEETDMEKLLSSFGGTERRGLRQRGKHLDGLVDIDEKYKQKKAAEKKVKTLKTDGEEALGNNVEETKSKSS
jgi:hypothetical protein